MSFWRRVFKLGHKTLSPHRDSGGAEAPVTPVAPDSPSPARDEGCLEVVTLDGSELGVLLTPGISLTNSGFKFLRAVKDEHLEYVGNVHQVKSNGFSDSSLQMSFECKEMIKLFGSSNKFPGQKFLEVDVFESIVVMHMGEDAFKVLVDWVYVPSCSSCFVPPELKVVPLKRVYDKKILADCHLFKDSKKEAEKDKVDLRKLSRCNHLEDRSHCICALQISAVPSNVVAKLESALRASCKLSVVQVFDSDTCL